MNRSGNEYDIAVIGAGASGMMAAIAAAPSGRSICLIDAMPRIGTKILKTGNGRCNLTHDPVTGDEYRGSGAERIGGFLDRFGVPETLDLFKELGLMTRSRDGYVYPYSETASDVLDVLRFAVRGRGITVLTEAYVKEIKKDGRGFVIEYPGKTGTGASDGTGKGKCCVIKAQKVIMTCGGAADPASGSDGNGYRLAEKLGLKVIKPLPALVKVKTDDSRMPIMAGVRARGKVWIDTPDGRMSDEGEMQFTKDGLSGIPVFNISRYISRALYDGHKVTVHIDLIPSMSVEELSEHISGIRQKRTAAGRSSENADRGMTAGEMLTGTVNKKISLYVFKRTGQKSDTPAENMTDVRIKDYVSCIKDMTFDITASYGFEQAQVTCGGVDFGEVDENLECIKIPGLYLAGEILDIDGPCGGYNLQWAWTSGYTAGNCAARTIKPDDLPEIPLK